MSAEKSSRVFVGQNYEPYPSGKLNWSDIALLRFLLYIFMIQKFLDAKSLLRLNLNYSLEGQGH